MIVSKGSCQQWRSVAARRARLHIGEKVAAVGGQKMAADASSTPVAWGFARISREPMDDLKEVLRQCLFGQCLIVAPELPPYLREERGVCHRICQSGVDAQAPITAGDRPEPRPGGGLLVPMRNLPRSSLRHSRPVPREV